MQAPRWTLTLIALVGALLIASSASAQVPPTVAFSGSLSTMDGPVDGQVDVTFRLFDQLTNGTEVWSESHALDADGGVVLAELGSAGSPLGLNVFNGADRWLEVEVDGEILTPRSAVASVPYAMLASAALDADALAGVGPSGWQARVTGSCAAGSAIRSISSNGMVNCESDDNTTYSAGNGLTQSGTQFSVNPAVVQSRVSNGCAVGSSIRVITQSGSVVCEPDSGSGAGDGLSASGAELQLNAPTFHSRSTPGVLNVSDRRFCALAETGVNTSCFTSVSGGSNWLLGYSSGSGTCRWICIPN